MLHTENPEKLIRKKLSTENFYFFFLRQKKKQQKLIGALNSMISVSKNPIVQSNPVSRHVVSTN